MIHAKKMKSMSEESRKEWAEQKWKSTVEKIEQAIQDASDKGGTECTLWIHPTMSDERVTKEVESYGYKVDIVRDKVGPTTRVTLNISWE